ncbi:hypothetical protein N2152v2_007939 [Parachlorella kessleri]
MEGMEVRRSSREKAPVDYKSVKINYDFEFQEPTAKHHGRRKQRQRTTQPGPVPTTDAEDVNLAAILQAKEECQLTWGEPAPDRPDIRAATRHRVKGFYKSVTLMEEAGAADGTTDNAGPANPPQLGLAANESSSGVSRVPVTYNVGDSVIAGWVRNDCTLDDLTVYRIYALFEDNQGVPYAVPQWFYFWEDIINAVGEPGAPDAAFRDRRQVSCQAEHALDGSNLVLRNLDDNLNCVLDILRPCTVRHYQHIPDLQAFEALPDHYWCRYMFDSSRLRWQELPAGDLPAPPATPARPAGRHRSRKGEAASQRQKLRWQQQQQQHEQAGTGQGQGPGPAAKAVGVPAALGRPEEPAAAGRTGRGGSHGVGGSRAAEPAVPAEPAGPRQAEQPTMMDFFAGLGTVGYAGQLSGFKVVMGVEKDPDAASAFCANLPGVRNPEMSQGELLERVKRGDPSVPAPGTVDYAHFSPPCQSLSSRNKWRCYPRFARELVPLLQEMLEVIRVMQFKYITIEEVPQFQITRLPLEERGSMGGKRGRPRREEGEEGLESGYEAEAGPEVEAEEEEEEGVEGEEEAVEAAAASAGGSVLVRPWLHVVPALLSMGYQVEQCFGQSAHYGVPQDRIRLMVMAARCGLPLPRPPPPRYHWPFDHIRLLPHDPCLMALPAVGGAGWKAISISSEGMDLPPAVTVWEAIGDLPPLLERSEKAAGSWPGSEPDEEEGAAGPSTSLQEQGRLQKLGRECCPYPHPPPHPPSRYAEYMRRGADSNLWHHRLAAGQRGAAPVDPDRLFPTICTQYHLGIQNGRRAPNQHPLEPRWFSIAERKRAQSMPDSIKLLGTIAEQGRQVGNAVPFLFAKALTDAIYETAAGRPALNPVPNLKGYCNASQPGLDAEEQQQQEQGQLVLSHAHQQEGQQQQLQQQEQRQQQQLMARLPAGGSTGQLQPQTAERDNKRPKLSSSPALPREELLQLHQRNERSVGGHTSYQQPGACPSPLPVKALPGCEKLEVLESQACAEAGLGRLPAGRAPGNAGSPPAADLVLPAAMAGAAAAAAAAAAAEPTGTAHAHPEAGRQQESRLAGNTCPDGAEVDRKPTPVEEHKARVWQALQASVKAESQLGPATAQQQQQQAQEQGVIEIVDLVDDSDGQAAAGAASVPGCEDVPEHPVGQAPKDAASPARAPNPSGAVSSGFSSFVVDLTRDHNE